MKTAITLVFLSSSFFCFAQSSDPTLKLPDKNFALIIDGNSFYNDDVISNEVLDKMSSHSLEVMDVKTKRHVKATSFECIISIKDSNAVWKFDATNLDHPPVHCVNCCKSLGFTEVSRLMKANDIIFIDQLKYDGHDIGLPKQFAFKVK